MFVRLVIFSLVSLCSVFLRFRVARMFGSSRCLLYNILSHIYNHRICWSVHACTLLHKDINIPSYDFDENIYLLYAYWLPITSHYIGNLIFLFIAFNLVCIHGRMNCQIWACSGSNERVVDSLCSHYVVNCNFLISVLLVCSSQIDCAQILNEFNKKRTLQRKTHWKSQLPWFARFL